jgi:hypothetical protein
MIREEHTRGTFHIKRKQMSDSFLMFLCPSNPLVAAQDDVQFSIYFPPWSNPHCGFWSFRDGENIKEFDNN